MLRESFLEAASTCCSQKIRLKESDGKSSYSVMQFPKYHMGSCTVIIFNVKTFKSVWMPSSTCIPSASQESAIFSFSR